MKKVIISIFIFLSIFIYMSCSSTSSNIEENAIDEVEPIVTKNEPIAQITLEPVESLIASQSNSPSNQEDSLVENEASAEAIEFTVDSEFPTEEVIQLTDIELYQQLIAGCTLEVVSSPKQITKNKKFATNFSVKCIKDNSPVPYMVVTVKYPVAQLNGEIAYAQTIIETNEEGIASFIPSDTSFSCNSNVYFYLTPETEDPETLEYAEKGAVSIPYKVITNRFYDSGILAIADYNASNRALSTNTTATSLQPPLRKAGFQTIGNAPFDASVITSKNLYTQAKNIFGNTVSFMIYGTVKYAEPAIKLESGEYSVTFVTNFSVMNLRDGKIIYTEEFYTTEFGASEWEATNNLRTKTIPQIITEKIIYGI